MNVEDRVEIKEAQGRNNWKWTKRFGKITDVDQYCYTVLADDGETVRDVHNHFREA